MDRPNRPENWTSISNDHLFPAHLFCVYLEAFDFGQDVVEAAEPVRQYQQYVDQINNAP
jgi:hypothetical protein